MRMEMVPPCVALLLAVGASGCAPSSKETSATGADSGWVDLTPPAGRLVGFSQSVDCAAASLPRVGPHDGWIHVRVNEIAARAIESGMPTRFAPSSVIVKEKFTRQHDNYGNDDPRTGFVEFAAGVGVMIKREPGYAPDDGDWQYLYFEPGDAPVVDPIAARDLPSLGHCAACHNQAAKQDHVYLPSLSRR